MKNRKQESASAGSRLSKFDWNFDAVPDAELVACCYWEYARESALIRELRQRCMKEQQAAGERDEKLPKDLQRVQSIGYPALIFLRGFFCPQDGVLPDPLPLRPGEVHRLTGSFPKPWQLLTKAERKYRSYEAAAAAQEELPQMRAYLAVIGDDSSLSHDEKMERVHAILYGWERSAGDAEPAKSSNGSVNEGMSA